MDAEPKDFAAHVREVQEELANSTRRAGLAPDPYARVVEAQSAALGVLPVFIEEISRARQPWTYDERRAVVKEAVKELRRETTAIVKEATARRTLLTAATALGLLLAGFGGGWWYRGDVPILAGVSAGSNKCEDRPDGSRLCWIPVWERLPPGQH